jgi:hypothetical protein
MITEEKATIQITARFNEERSHRYYLRRQWNENESKTACIIMSNASNADIIQGDLTGMIIQNNLAALQFSSCIIVNLFSRMVQKLDLSGNLDELTDESNTKEILNAIRSTDVCIVSIGTLAKTYRKVAVYQHKLFERIKKEGLQAKIHTIAAPDGSLCLHPISSKLRDREAGTWRLVPFTLPEPPKESTPELPPQEPKTTEKKNKK